MVRRRYSALLAALLAALLSTGCKVRDGLNKADQLAAEGRWKEAVDAYEQVLRDYPHSYRAAWGITAIYCNETHHFDKCLRWSERLLDTYPDDSRYRRARAQGLRDRAAYSREHGDEASATADEREADRLSPPPS